MSAYRHPVERFVQIVKLIRPLNCLPAIIGIWVGAHLTWFSPQYLTPAITSLAVFLICGAGNALNDYLNVEIDRVNRPERADVQNDLSRRYTLVIIIALNAVAVLIALTVNREVTILALAAIILLVAHNLYLKKVPVAGNVVVSILAGLTFVAGGMAIDTRFALELPGPLIGFVFVFLFYLVWEMVKDVGDVNGDRLAGVRTLPQVIGMEKSLLVALGLFLLLTILTFVPILAGWYGGWYKIIAVYIVELPLLAFLILLWGNPTHAMLRTGSKVLKVGMGLGIVALILG